MPTLTLPDGRTLAWEEQGDPDGAPVLSLHGSPGSRLNRPPLHDRLAEAHIRQITYDRPGYGLSDPQPGRRVVDAVSDVEALLDSLDLERVAVLGGSGGGPHALALATALPHRCTVVHCNVGVAPHEVLGEQFFQGMDPQNVRRVRAALQGRDTSAEEFRVDMEEIATQAQTDPGNVFSHMVLPESDRATLRDLGSSITAGLVESGRQGPWGFLDDFIAIATPWGFDPARATARVIIEYGRDDVNVPGAHGDWLASHVPNIDVRAHTGAGHIRSQEETFANLVELAQFSGDAAHDRPTERAT